MSTDSRNTPHDSYQQNEIDRIFDSVWETVVRRNPMVFLRFQRIWRMNVWPIVPSET
jgi:hypothetical protein